jgi:hypothetical protein
MDSWRSNAMCCPTSLKDRHDALKRSLSQLFGTTRGWKSIEPVGVFAGVQEVREHQGHCLLADDGQDLFADTSQVTSNDGPVQVAPGEFERRKANKYGEKGRRMLQNWVRQRTVPGESLR